MRNRIDTSTVKFRVAGVGPRQVSRADKSQKRTPPSDGNRLICLAGGSKSTVVAFDIADGHEIWRALTAKEPGYCPPVIIQASGKRQLILWEPRVQLDLIHRWYHPGLFD